jgi:hypothetical protein
MTPPPNAPLVETVLGTVWLEGEILCDVKKRAPQTLANMQQHLDAISHLLQGRKVCLLVEVSHLDPPDKRARDYATFEMPKHFRAIAGIGASPLARMIANLFMALKGEAVPTRLFSNEAEARSWLKKYC